MYENIEESAFKLLNQFRRVTIPFIMRKFKLRWDFAEKLCIRLWLRQHNEARILAIKIEVR